MFICSFRFQCAASSDMALISCFIQALLIHVQEVNLIVIFVQLPCVSIIHILILISSPTPIRVGFAL